jgi:hypothetical protein
MGFSASLERNRYAVEGDGESIPGRVIIAT